MAKPTVTNIWVWTSGATQQTDGAIAVPGATPGTRLIMFLGFRGTATNYIPDVSTNWPLTHNLIGIPGQFTGSLTVYERVATGIEAEDSADWTIGSTYQQSAIVLEVTGAGGPAELVSPRKPSQNAVGGWPDSSVGGQDELSADLSPGMTPTTVDALVLGWFNSRDRQDWSTTNSTTGTTTVAGITIPAGFEWVTYVATGSNGIGMGITTTDITDLSPIGGSYSTDLATPGCPVSIGLLQFSPSEPPSEEGGGLFLGSTPLIPYLGGLIFQAVYKGATKIWPTLPQFPYGYRAARFDLNAAAALSWSSNPGITTQAPSGNGYATVDWGTDIIPGAMPVAGTGFAVATTWDPTFAQTMSLSPTQTSLTGMYVGANPTVSGIHVRQAVPIENDDGLEMFGVLVDSLGVILWSSLPGITCVRSAVGVLDFTLPEPMLDDCVWACVQDSPSTAPAQAATVQTLTDKPNGVHFTVVSAIPTNGSNFSTPVAVTGFLLGGS